MFDLFDLGLDQLFFTSPFECHQVVLDEKDGRPETRAHRRSQTILSVQYMSGDKNKVLNASLHYITIIDELEKFILIYSSMS